MKLFTKGKLECAVCGKGVQHSNLVSFSKRRVHHVRRPNLHSHKLEMDGATIKIKVCTACKRALRLTQRESLAKNNAAKEALTAIK